MNRSAFARLLAQRCRDASASGAPLPAGATVAWELTWNYPHFHTPRGYGVTLWSKTAPTRCEILFAPKILQAPRGRADGVVRHEFGHVLDLLCPAPQLNSWARQRGVLLATTPELRADDIARVVWGRPLAYDTQLFVQTTGAGIVPRPSHLGA